MIQHWLAWLTVLPVLRYVLVNLHSLLFVFVPKLPGRAVTWNAMLKTFWNTDTVCFAHLFLFFWWVHFSHTQQCADLGQCSPNLKAFETCKPDSWLASYDPGHKRHIVFSFDLNGWAHFVSEIMTSSWCLCKARWFLWNCLDLTCRNISGEQVTCIHIASAVCYQFPVHSPHDIQSCGPCHLLWHDSSELMLFIL